MLIGRSALQSLGMFGPHGDGGVMCPVIPTYPIGSEKGRSKASATAFRSPADRNFERTKYEIGRNGAKRETLSLTMSECESLPMSTYRTFL